MQSRMIMHTGFLSVMALMLFAVPPVGRKNSIRIVAAPVGGELTFKPVPSEQVFTLLETYGIVPTKLGPALVKQTHERILGRGLLGNPLPAVGVLGDSVISCYCKLLKVPTSVALSY